MLRSRPSLEARQREMRQRQPARRGRGRPPLPIHREDVRRLARMGCNAEEIAATLGCCPNTLRNRFREEIERGHVWLSGTLKQIIWKKAVVEGDPRAIMWELRCRGLYAPARAPRRPRRPRATAASLQPLFRRRVGRAHQPFRNRYPAQRRCRRKPEQLASPPPVAAPVQPTTSPPKPRRGWYSGEILWG